PEVSRTVAVDRKLIRANAERGTVAADANIVSGGWVEARQGQADVVVQNVLGGSLGNDLAAAVKNLDLCLNEAQAGGTQLDKRGRAVCRCDKAIAVDVARSRQIRCQGRRVGCGGGQRVVSGGPLKRIGRSRTVKSLDR